MQNEFEMSNLGLFSYYLGVEVEQKRNCITLKQSSYARKILQLAGMSDCNAALYPMESKLKLCKDEEGEAVNSTQYRRLIGSLRYLTHTRPDLAYSVGLAADTWRIQSSPMLKQSSTS